MDIRFRLQTLYIGHKTLDVVVSIHYLCIVTLSQLLSLISNLLLQVVVESRVAGIEYGDIVVEEGSVVNPDLHFDSQLMHLYVMTERMVSDDY